MTNEQLTAYLQDESYLYSVGYEELKSLVMSYPYSANLRILLLKKSYLDQNKDYERNLQMSATFTTNRKHLYKTIKKLKSFKLAPQNVILGEDYLELTELSNIERLLAEKHLGEAVQSEAKYESLAADWTLEIDDLVFNENEKDDEITTDEALFELPSLPQNLDNQSKPKKSDDEAINSLISNLVTEYKAPVGALDVTLALGSTINGNGHTSNGEEKNHIDFEEYIEAKTDAHAHSETPPSVSDAIFDLYDDAEDIQDDDDMIVEQELRMMVGDKKTNSLTVDEVENIAVSNSVLAEKENQEEVKKGHVEREIIQPKSAPIVEPIVAKSTFDTKPTFTEWLSQFRMTQTQNGNGAVKPIARTAETPVNQIVTPPPVVVEPLRKVSRQSMSELLEAKNDVPDNLFGFSINDSQRVHFIDDEDDDDEIFSDYQTNSPKKKKLRPMHQLAAKSLVQDEEMASETLADLLAWQGNHKKAIGMYQKLILRFPEKSGYFATKIEKISN